MTQIKSILAASDLSEASDEVIAAAARIAAMIQAELHVIHAFDFPSPSEEGLASVSFHGRIEAAERKLDRQIQRTVPAAVKVASRRVEIYVAHRAILDAALGAAAGLIVMGPHSRRRAGDAILGGTADRVLRTSEVPCLVVRAPLSLPLRRVLVPFDLSSPAIGALDVALEWTVALGIRDDAAVGPELTVLHVMPRALDIPEFPFNHATIGPALHAEAEAARQRVSGAGQLDVREEVRWGDSPVDDIVEVAASENVDLIALGTHGPGLLKRALIGSVASGVARRAPCPVLLVPPHLAVIDDRWNEAPRGVNVRGPDHE